MVIRAQPSPRACEGNLWPNWFWSRRRTCNRILLEGYGPTLDALATLSHQPVSTRARPLLLTSSRFPPSLLNTTTARLDTLSPSPTTHHRPSKLAKFATIFQQTQLNNQEPSLRMTIRSPDGALPRYLLPNGFPNYSALLLAAFCSFQTHQRHPVF